MQRWTVTAVMIILTLIGGLAATTGAPGAPGRVGSAVNNPDGLDERGWAGDAIETSPVDGLPDLDVEELTAVEPSADGGSIPGLADVPGLPGFGLGPLLDAAPPQVQPALHGDGPVPIPNLPDPAQAVYSIRTVHDGVERHHEAVAYTPNPIDATGDGIPDLTAQLVAVPELPEQVVETIDAFDQEVAGLDSPNLRAYYRFVPQQVFGALRNEALGLPEAALDLVEPVEAIAGDVEDVLDELDAFIEVALETTVFANGLDAGLVPVPIHGGAALKIDLLDPGSTVLPVLVEATALLDADEGDTVRAGYDARATRAPATFAGVAARDADNGIDLTVDVDGAGYSLGLIGGFADVTPGTPDSLVDIDAAVSYTPVPTSIRFDLEHSESAETATESLRVDATHDAAGQPPVVDGRVRMTEIELPVAHHLPSHEVDVHLHVDGMPPLLGFTHEQRPVTIPEPGDPDARTNELYYRAGAPVGLLDVTLDLTDEGRAGNAIRARLQDVEARAISVIQDGASLDVQTFGGNIGRTDVAISRFGAHFLPDLPPRGEPLPEAVNVQMSGPYAAEEAGGDEDIPARTAWGVVSLNGLVSGHVDWNNGVELSLDHAASPLDVRIEQNGILFTATMQDLPGRVYEVDVEMEEESVDDLEPGELPDADGDGRVDEQRVAVTYRASADVGYIGAQMTSQRSSIRGPLVAMVEVRGVPTEMSVGFDDWSKRRDYWNTTEEDVTVVTYDASGELGSISVLSVAEPYDAGPYDEPDEGTDGPLGPVGYARFELRGLDPDTTATMRRTEDEKTFEYASSGRIEAFEADIRALERAALEEHTSRALTKYIAARILDIPPNVTAVVHEDGIDVSAGGGPVPGIGLLEFFASEDWGFLAQDGLILVDTFDEWTIRARIHGLRGARYRSFSDFRNDDGRPAFDCGVGVNVCVDTKQFELRVDAAGPFVLVVVKGPLRIEASIESLPAHTTFDFVKGRYGSRDGDEIWHVDDETLEARWDGHGQDGGVAIVRIVDGEYDDDYDWVETETWIVLEPLPAELGFCYAKSWRCHGDLQPYHWRKGTLRLDASRHTNIQLVQRVVGEDLDLKVNLHLQKLQFGKREAKDWGPDDIQVAVDTDGHQVWGTAFVKDELELRLPKEPGISALAAQDWWVHVGKPSLTVTVHGSMYCPVGTFVSLKDKLGPLNATFTSTIDPNTGEPIPDWLSIRVGGAGLASFQC